MAERRRQNEEQQQSLPHLDTHPYCIGNVSIAPIGADSSMTKYTETSNACMKKHGLKHKVRACSTEFEGPFDEVMATLRECHQDLHELGVPRICSTITVETISDTHKHHMSLDERDKVVSQMN
ncbi:hypothetical protein BDF19DRAFT_450346 [Syncephalis fuscata]|nr:hypothetical protein BDF19DRAFT_450346 [Syncephalis fuscata]